MLRTTDHGGLPLAQQRPPQQSLAMQLLASELSTAGYVTVATILGWQNVLDQLEGFTVDCSRERDRDPGLYYLHYLRVFGEPGAPGRGGLALRRHHVWLNNLVVDNEVRSVTPCFLGAEPATAPGLGGGTLRRWSGSRTSPTRWCPRCHRSCGTWPCSWTGRRQASSAATARASPTATMLLLPDIWNGRVTEPRLRDRVEAMTAAAEAATGYGPEEHRRLALTSRPRGVPGSRWTRPAGAAGGAAVGPPGTGPRRAGRSGRPGAGAPGLGRVARAGGAALPAPGPRLLTEWDDTARDADHAHSAWRDPEADFGTDVLVEHRHVHHGG